MKITIFFIRIREMLLLSLANSRGFQGTELRRGKKTSFQNLYIKHVSIRKKT